MYLNRLTIIGFVGNDVEAKLTTSGKTFAQFSVATKTSWKDDKGEWQSNTEWHRVVVWGEKLAAYAATLKKGAHVQVEGPALVENKTRRRFSPGTNSTPECRMLLHDVRSGARAVSRNPGVSLIVVATFALGIGMNVDANSLFAIYVRFPKLFRCACRTGVAMKTGGVDTIAKWVQRGLRILRMA